VTSVTDLRFLKATAPRRFPPPWSVEDFEFRLVSALSERQRKGCPVFSFFLHFIAKKFSKKTFPAA